jgi:hypothetical protein
VGIIGSEIASSAQLKVEEEIVPGIGGSEIEIGMKTGVDSEMVGSVCVDIDAEKDRGMIRELV